MAINTIKQTILLMLIFLGYSLIMAAAIKHSKFLTIDVQEDLAHNSVQSIAQDKYGFIWFGTLNGLSRYDGYTIKNYQASQIDSNSISNNRIQLIYIDKNQDVWVSTFDTLLCRYNYHTDDFTRFKRKNVSKEVLDSTNRFVNQSRQHAEGGGKEFSIIENQFLVVKDKQTRKIIHLDDLLSIPLKISDYNCLYKDRTNVLWIGTNYNGVIKIDLMANQFKSTENNIVKNGKSISTAIRCILKDTQSIWLGTFENGLIQIEDKTGFSKQFTKTAITGQLTASNKVRAIFKDHTNNIWIGYNKGVDQINSNTYTLQQVSQRGSIPPYDKIIWEQMSTLPKRISFTIIEDKENNLWFGSYNGIFRYKNNSYKFFDLSEYAKNSIVTSMFCDSKNNLWVGTEYGGLIFLKRNTNNGILSKDYHYHFTNEIANSLPDNRVSSIQEDKLGMIWVGTESGLCRINPQNNQTSIFNQSSGLDDAGIACLLLDNKDQLWMSHKKGISKIEIGSLAIKNYHIPIIDNGSQFIFCSGFYDKENNKLYFGHTNGYVSFSPDEIQDNPFRPNVILTELKIDNRVLKVNQQINHRTIITSPIFDTPKVTLTHKEKSISIRFSANHYANPELNQYKYMLEGFDTNYIVTNSKNRIATYSNLKPGTYLFKVKAANANNLWSINDTQLQIVVLTPWWFSWQAFSVYFLVVAGLFYLFISMFLSKQKLKVERIKSEKITEVNRIKTNFYTNVSHELRTPLTLILDPINRMISNPDDEQNKIRTEVIKRNAERLLYLVNQLLDVRKAEKGRLSLKLQPINLNHLIENTVKAFQANATERQISIDIQLPNELIIALVDRKKIETVLYNLLSNAFKNAYKSTVINICLQSNKSPSSTSIDLRVTNIGKTIRPENIIKLFDPFYQVNSQSIGTGLGLAISRQIIELHGGVINASSNKEITCFYVKIPNKKADENSEKLQANTIEQKQGIFAVKETKYTNSIAPLTSDKLPHILIIEDNLDIRNYIKTELSNSFVIQEADNGVSGIEKVKNLIPDLVITDVMMPEKNGYEVCSALKNDIRTCHIPVIILTARHSEESIIEGYQTGADSYVTKPFSIQVLESRIFNLLKTRQKLATFYHTTENEIVHKKTTSQAENIFLKELKRKILNLDGVYNVEILAENMNMSRSQLYRKTKAITQQSASDFIAKVRMDYACQLLKEGQYNVSEIALKLGYSEQANFSRSFYRYFGMYPTQFLSKKSKE